jgi:metal-responsive CopG/Arc/MetJ family transcriptional regulator
MSKLIAIRIDEELLAEVDRERKKSRLPRSRAMTQALSEWLAARRRAEAERRDREGYERRPTRAGEFSPVLGAQVWPGERRK